MRGRPPDRERAQQRARLERALHACRSFIFERRRNLQPVSLSCGLRRTLPWIAVKVKRVRSLVDDSELSGGVAGDLSICSRSPRGSREPQRKREEGLT